MRRFPDISMRLAPFNTVAGATSQFVEFLLLFCPIVVLILLGTWTLGSSRIHAEMTTLLAEERTYVELGKSRLDQEMAVPIRHLLSLTKEKPVGQVFEAPRVVDASPMEEAFFSLLSRNPDYDQVRWIDPSGRERVRVNNSEQGPVLVAEAELQDKSGRYFFTEAMQVGAGQIYISPLDLNIDNGEVNQPYKPTIRVATPIFDADGDERGILIINVAARAMLNAFSSSVGPAAKRLMLLNADGFWLQSPNKADEWGFMFHRNATMKVKNPSLWQEISMREQGQIRLGDGLWSWNSVSPAPVIDERLANNMRWKVLTHLPASELEALEKDVWGIKIASASVLLLLFGIGIRRVIQAKAARMQAEKEAALAHSEAEAAHKIQEAQASFQMLFEANTSGLLVVNDGGQIMMANPALEAMFGYRVSELTGKMVEVLVPEVLASKHVALREAFFNNPVNRSMGAGRDLYGAHKEGGLFPIEVGLSSYRHNNQTFVLATIVDISERKQAQDQILRMNEILEQRVSERTKELQAARLEAERLANVKGNFLANMSHEIRTPMNAILGVAYLLEKANLDSESQELVKKIRIAGRSLLGIINDILDFSKIESGRLEIEYAPFRLSNVLDNVATLISTIEKKQSVELIMGPAPEGVDLLRGDALRLEQILVNLASNALKFTEQGSVTLTVERIAHQADQERLRFSVKDTGIGIAKDKQAEIFNAFAQEDSSTTRRFGGSGLGLSICSWLVQMMKGDIGVVSEPGEGSEFWLELPFERVELQDYVQPTLAFQNVLIADDHPVAREMMAATVRSLGWNPEVVSSGEDAVQRVIERAQHNKLPDLIFLDWRMPGMDGLEAGVKIKEALGDMPNAPIIMMATAFDRDALLKQPCVDRINAILNKPVTASSLFNAVFEAKQRVQQSDADLCKALIEDGAGRLLQLNVLVVDDSEINRDMARRILEAEGAQVQLADDGAAALKCLRLNSQRTDVVLMDIQMPMMDGYETTRQIRDELGLTTLPVIALTAGAFKNQQTAAFAAGMNGFVAKPFDVDELINMLQQYVVTQTSEKYIAGPEKIEPVSDSSDDAVIDLERGMCNWGEARNYHKYLTKFVETHGRDGEKIGALITSGDVEQASALAHKMKGAAGNLAIMAVWKLAEKLERQLVSGETTSDGPQRLQAALDQAQAKIKTLIQAPEIRDRERAGQIDYEAAVRLLRELLQALDSDNPDRAEPFLQALEKLLPLRMLTPIREMLDNFDFRAAETQAQALIEELNSKPEEI